MVGLAIAVAAVLAERWPSASAAGVTEGVSADLVAVVDADVGAGIGADQGGSAEAMSWRPPAWRVGILAGSRVLSSPGCAGTARFGLEQGNHQPASVLAVRAVRAVRPASIPATRGRKAAASSQAWGLAAGMASAWRAAASCRVLSAGPSRPKVANALEAVRQDLLRRSRLTIRRPASFEKRRSCRAHRSDGKRQDLAPGAGPQAPLFAEK